MNQKIFLVFLLIFSVIVVLVYITLKQNTKSEDGETKETIDHEKIIYVLTDTYKGKDQLKNVINFHNKDLINIMSNLYEDDYKCFIGFNDPSKDKMLVNWLVKHPDARIYSLCDRSDIKHHYFYHGFPSTDKTISNFTSVANKYYSNMNISIINNNNYIIKDNTIYFIYSPFSDNIINTINSICNMDNVKVVVLSTNWDTSKFKDNKYKDKLYFFKYQTSITKSHVSMLNNIGINCIHRNIFHLIDVTNHYLYNLNKPVYGYSGSLSFNNNKEREIIDFEILDINDNVLYHGINDIERDLTII